MIAGLVRQVGTVSVEELYTKFESSAETIRRDLNVLANVENVKKMHAGATIPLTEGKGPLPQRLGDNVAAKWEIAKKAVAMASPEQTITIDTQPRVCINASAATRRG